MHIDPQQQKDPVTLEMFLAVMRDWFEQTTNMANSAWPSHVTQQFNMGKFMMEQMLQASDRVALVNLLTDKGPVATLLREHVVVESRKAAFLSLKRDGVVSGDIGFDIEGMIKELAPFRGQFSKARFNSIIGKYFSVDDWRFKSKHAEQQFTEVSIEGAELKKNLQGKWRLLFNHQQKNGSHVSYEINPSGVSYHVTKVYNALERCEHQGGGEHIDIDWMCDKLSELMLAAGWSEELYMERLMTREQFEEALTKHFEELPTPETMREYDWRYDDYRYTAPRYIEEFLITDNSRQWTLSTTAVPGSSDAVCDQRFEVSGVDYTVTHLGGRDSSSKTEAEEALHENCYRFIFNQIVKERTKGIEKYLESMKPKENE